MGTVRGEEKRPGQALELSDEAYEALRNLILARSGFRFRPERRNVLAKTLLTAATNAGCDSLKQYFAVLYTARTDSPLWDNLISLLTVGETYFFRNKAHINLLRNHVLPGLIASHGSDHRLRIWCAGCATGEEPYTIAILLAQLLPDIDSWNVSILATDINKKSLQRAQEGCYGQWSFRETDPEVQKMYFTSKNGRFEINPRMRKMVTFAYLNLSENAYPSLPTNTNAMDLIFCRNVMIYLSSPIIRLISERFHLCLVPGGWLIVGSAETNGNLYSQFAVRNFPGATVYQKVAEESPDVVRPAVQPAIQWSAAPGPCPEPACPEPSRRIEVPSTQHAVQPTPESGRFEPLRQTIGSADFYQEGLALLGRRCYEDALARFLAYVEANPDFAPAHCQIARVLANMGRLGEARSWAQRALERDSLLVEAHYVLALVHQEEGAGDEAIARLKKVLYLDPGFLLGHFSLAALFQRMGRGDEAARHRSQTIRLAAKLPPEGVVPYSDGLSVARLLTMMQATV